jgi:hypothetical protein
MWSGSLFSSLCVVAGTVVCVLSVLVALVTGTTPISGTLLMLVLCDLGDMV